MLNLDEWSTRLHCDLLISGSQGLVGARGAAFHPSAHYPPRINPSGVMSQIKSAKCLAFSIDSKCSGSMSRRSMLNLPLTGAHALRSKWVPTQPICICHCHVRTCGRRPSRPPGRVSPAPLGPGYGVVVADRESWLATLDRFHGWDVGRRICAKDVCVGRLGVLFPWRAWASLR